MPKCQEYSTFHGEKAWQHFFTCASDCGCPSCEPIGEDDADH